MGRLHFTASTQRLFDSNPISAVHVHATDEFLSCFHFDDNSSVGGSDHMAVFVAFQLISICTWAMRMDTNTHQPPSQRGQINWKLQFPRLHWKHWPNRFVSLSINWLAAYSKPIYPLYHESVMRGIWFIFEFQEKTIQQNITTIDLVDVFVVVTLSFPAFNWIWHRISIDSYIFARLNSTSVPCSSSSRKIVLHWCRLSPILPPSCYLVYFHPR